MKLDERTKELAASVRRKIAESKEKRKPPHFTAEEWALIQQGEFYPCKPEIFEQTYEPATRPRPDAGEEVRDEDRWMMFAKSVREYPNEPVMNLVQQFFPSLLSPKQENDTMAWAFPDS